eukprot:SAG31_NODE_733_length_12491_cov_7.073112_6_plen_120_part_00
MKGIILCISNLPSAFDVDGSYCTLYLKANHFYTSTNDEVDMVLLRSKRGEKDFFRSTLNGLVTQRCVGLIAKSTIAIHMANAVVTASRLATKHRLAWGRHELASLCEVMTLSLCHYAPS